VHPICTLYSKECSCCESNILPHLCSLTQTNHMYVRAATQRCSHKGQDEEKREMKDERGDESKEGSVDRMY